MIDIIVELTIRQNWNQITLGEYFRYRDILSDPMTSIFTKYMEILALVAKVEVDEIRKLPARKVYDTFAALTFLEEEPTGPVKERYELNGRHYALAHHAEDISTGQYIDLTEYTKDPKRLIDNCADIIATILIPEAEDPIEANGVKIRRKRPKLEEYLDTPRAETVETIMNHMSVTEALGISTFFIWSSMLSTAVSRGYSEVMSRESQTQ